MSSREHIRRRKSSSPTYANNRRVVYFNICLRTIPTTRMSLSRVISTVALVSRSTTSYVMRASRVPIERCCTVKSLHLPRGNFELTAASTSSNAERLIICFTNRKDSYRSPFCSYQRKKLLALTVCLRLRTHRITWHSRLYSLSRCDIVLFVIKATVLSRSQTGLSIVAKVRMKGENHVLRDRIRLIERMFDEWATARF